MIGENGIIVRDGGPAFEMGPPFLAAENYRIRPRWE